MLQSNYAVFLTVPIMQDLIFFFNLHCQEEKMQMNPPKNIDKNQNKTKIKTPLPRENH